MLGRDDCDDGLLRVSPEELGMSSAAVLEFLDAIDAKGIEMNSFMLCRYGKVAAEGWWWPYAPHRVHMLHSMTKALTSTGVGLALAEGRFRLADPVISFFPEHLPPEVSANLRSMTVEHLLTQTSGHAKGISGSIWRKINTSWIAEFFKEPVPHVPGTHFAYSSATSFMLSAIVTRTTGLSLHDYLRPRLFEPLGIKTLRWDGGPEGINPGGNGASATTADFLKIAALYCAKGLWNGVQILPNDWVQSAGTGKNGNPYGYHWWVSPDHSGYFAFGAFGQYAMVFPELDVAAVTTAAVPGSISRPDNELPPLIWKYVPKMCQPVQRSAADVTPTGASTLLRQRTAQLQLLQPLRSQVAPLAASVSGRRYIAEPNADGVKAIQIEFGESLCLFTLETESGLHRIEVGLDRWIEGETSMPGMSLHHGYEPPSLKVVAGGEWKAPETFEMAWQFVETSFRDTVRLQFNGSKLILDRAVNVNGAAMSRPQITAHAS